MQMSTTEMGDALVVKVEETRIDAAVAVRFKDKMLEHTETTTNRIINVMLQAPFR